MLTVADFVSQYDKHSNQEILHIYNNINEYGNEAQEALNIIIEKRGGIDKLLNEEKQQRFILKEKNRIAKETKKWVLKV